MKGIILAGGSGTRLHPTTKVVSKQLIPVWDKPMIYYPLSTLMLSGIRDVLIISTPQDKPLFQRLFGDGKELGMNFFYAEQPSPAGIAQAFIIGEAFIGSSQVSLVLGDNIFYGVGLSNVLQKVSKKKVGATVFCYPVKDPQRYGVLGFDSYGVPVSIEEKPIAPSSNYAVTGLYFYDNRVINVAKSLKPSKRGELEITDVNRWYLEKGELDAERLGRGIAWLDTGTPESLLQASNFIGVIEERQGLKIACIEEIAYRMGFIDENRLSNLLTRLPAHYSKYLETVLEV